MTMQHYSEVGRDDDGMSLTILLHSSKTMTPTESKQSVSRPQFLHEASTLAEAVNRLTDMQLQQCMHVSPKLAQAVREMYASWTPDSSPYPAIESFRGDIYSGLRARAFTVDQARFAQKHLVVLSGLYGLLRPYDGIQPYRLEAAYKIPLQNARNVYDFWGSRLAETLPSKGPIINVTSGEYEKLIVPYLRKERIITPKFLSRVAGKPEPVFVAVHAKIARGAYARWLIQRGVDSAEDLDAFNDLGYVYQPELSTPRQPVYICDSFQGIGLSQRLA